MCELLEHNLAEVGGQRHQQLRGRALPLGDNFGLARHFKSSKTGNAKAEFGRQFRRRVLADEPHALEELHTMAHDELEMSLQD